MSLSQNSTPAPGFLSALNATGTETPVAAASASHAVGGTVVGAAPAVFLAGSTYGQSNPFNATQAQVLAALNGSKLTYTGSGITVGVISDSFNDLGTAAQDEADGALPNASDVNILEDLPKGGTDEGRAMMEIVHDVAPAAKLDFYTADVNEQDFANGILALANAGCRVICDDISYFDEPFFQTGVVANAIHTVEQQGVTFVTCAANFGEEGYQATWNPIASTTFDGITLTDTQDFGTSGSPNPVQTVTIQNVTVGGKPLTVPLILQWNQPYGTVTTNTADLALILFSNGAYVNSYNISETGNPYVNLTLSPGTYQVAIENLAPANGDPTLIQEMLAANGSLQPFVTLGSANSGTVVGHHMSSDAITVGAVDAGNTPGDGGVSESEFYSSSGANTQLWYNYDGTPVANGVLNLNPVAVSGIDDIATSVTDDGLNDFFGTSAATPSVAGVIADMLVH